jgi:hypothetical protein
MNVFKMSVGQMFICQYFSASCFLAKVLGAQI